MVAVPLAAAAAWYTGRVNTLFSRGLVVSDDETTRDTDAPEAEEAAQERGGGGDRR